MPRAMGKDDCFATPAREVTLGRLLSYAPILSDNRNFPSAIQCLGGENYVLWGGREDYETPFNPDFGRETGRAGAILPSVVDHKQKIGFPGTILIEPKPQQPSKHQIGNATGYGFLKRFGLANAL